MGGKSNVALGKYVDVERELPETYLVIYGSGWEYPDAPKIGMGKAFERVGTARYKLNTSAHSDEINILTYCTTDVEFFETINSCVNIKRLDVYCHGFAHGLNLGGFKGKRIIGGVEMDSKDIDWKTKEQNTGADLRRVDVHENIYFPGSVETNELTQMDASVFNDSVEVYFWGCNVGGQLDKNGNHILGYTNDKKEVKDPKDSFAQKFAEQIGKGTIFALVGKGAEGAGSMCKIDEKGENYYKDGEMLPANIVLTYKANGKPSSVLKAMDYMKKFPL